MTPTEADIKKQKQKLSDFLKKIDKDTGKSSETAMLNMVRGAIRRSWMKSPTKLAYLYSKIEPDMDDTNRRKWKVACECCGGWFKMTDVEVDHKHGNHSLRTVEDFCNYFEKILMVGFDDLQLLCKPCHATKTLMESQGLTREEAVATQKAILIEKSKKSSEFLESNSIKAGRNAADRRKQLVSYFLSNP